MSDERNEGEPMSEIEVDQFQGFSDNHYQHDMHTLAWISLWLIIVLGVGAGVFGFFWGLTQ